jgi:osmotically-inducible protein OsmY
MKGETTELSIDLTTAEGATELETRIQCRLGGHVRDFQLVVEQKGLILRGFAHTYYAKQLAQHTVMGATKLPILANEIEVS